MTPFRVGVIGARRERNGLGPFVTRDLARAGAVVPCFLATSAESRDAAVHELRDWFGLEARGHLDLDALRQEGLDALAILSPAETHLAYLEFALETGLHVLCEKPFVWGQASLDARATELTRAFEAADLMLWENCQWPYTLPGYERLFPEIRARAPERFEMSLQPASTGLQALGDSLPHALSLLQALGPGEAPALDDVRFDTTDARSPLQRVRFRYRTREATTEAEIHLAQAKLGPREAAIVVDGRRVRREIASPDYRMSFRAGDRTVPLDDPLTLLVGDFVANLGRGARASRAREIRERMVLLARIADAFVEASARAS